MAIDCTTPKSKTFWSRPRCAFFFTIIHHHHQPGDHHYRPPLLNYLLVLPRNRAGRHHDPLLHCFNSCFCGSFVCRFNGGRIVPTHQTSLRGRDTPTTALFTTIPQEHTYRDTLVLLRKPTQPVSIILPPLHPTSTDTSYYSLHVVRYSFNHSSPHHVSQRNGTHGVSRERAHGSPFPV